MTPYSICTKMYSRNDLISGILGYSFSTICMCKSKMTVVPHPQYLSDLVPHDFYLQGQRCNDITMIHAKLLDAHALFQTVCFTKCFKW